MGPRSFWSKVLASLLMTTFALPACGSSESDLPLGSPSRERPPPSQSDTPISGSPTPPAPPEPPPPPAPPPLGGEVGKWTWLDVPESKCGNGQPTGIGVNIGTSSELLIFLEGGGACWDEFTCAGLGIAGHIKDGYTKATFESLYSGPLGGSVLDRNAENNPFKAASFVMVPYCTGDVHSGDAVQQWIFPPRPMHYAGRKNIEAFLSKIAPAFKNASRVTLSGSSAGGFGAALNYWRVKEAFGDTRVDLIDDSGPPFEQGNIPLLGAWKQAWNMDGVLPPDCAECKSNIASVASYYSTTYPTARFSFLSYDYDNIISVIFLSTQPAFAQNLRAVNENRLGALPNWRYFVVPGVSHTTLYTLGAVSGGIDVGSWLGQMTSDSPAWSNVAPY